MAAFIAVAVTLSTTLKVATALVSVTALVTASHVSKATSTLVFASYMATPSRECVEMPASRFVDVTVPDVGAINARFHRNGAQPPRHNACYAGY